MSAIRLCTAFFAVAAIFAAQPLLAQPSNKAEANHLRTLLRTDPMTIDIPEDKKSDHSSCDASEGEALIAALNNCWPILQAFQKYRANKEAATKAALAIGEKVRSGEVTHGSEAHEAMKAQAKADNLQAAQELYDMTKAREYPLQDMTLFLANLTRTSIAGVTGDYQMALPYLEDNIRIMETTKMTEPGFVTLEPLRKERERYLQYIAEQKETEDP